jgi:hypothetical protein
LTIALMQSRTRSNASSGPRQLVSPSYPIKLPLVFIVG